MNLNIGVIFIGSLDWESKNYGEAFRRTLTDDDHQRIERRTKWRNDRFRKDAASEYYVSVPIRYGRKSATRGGSFTMVVSPECASRLGTAKAIRCKRDVTSIDDLTTEAIELWVAESKEVYRGKLSARWGCVALLIPPSFLEAPDQKERSALLANWARLVAREKHYGQLRFSAKDQEVAGGNIIASGQLQIPWPTLADGRPVPFDLLLATVTDPEIGAPETRDYPSAKDIANAWHRAPEYEYYFRNNKLAGIQTSDDSEIDILLNQKVPFAG